MDIDLNKLQLYFKGKSYLDEETMTPRVGDLETGMGKKKSSRLEENYKSNKQQYQKQ